MRTQLDACSIATGASLRDAINAIDRGGVQIALMVDGEGRLVGTLTIVVWQGPRCETIGRHAHGC